MGTRLGWSTAPASRLRPPREPGRSAPSARNPGRTARRTRRPRWAAGGGGDPATGTHQTAGVADGARQTGESGMTTAGQVRLFPPIAERLDALAEASGMTRSELLRTLVLEATMPRTPRRSRTATNCSGCWASRRGWGTCRRCGSCCATSASSGHRPGRWAWWTSWPHEGHRTDDRDPGAPGYDRYRSRSRASSVDDLRERRRPTPLGSGRLVGERRQRRWRTECVPSLSLDYSQPDAIKQLIALRRRRTRL